jgi:hypothetical protein
VLMNRKKPYNTNSVTSRPANTGAGRTAALFVCVLVLLGCLLISDAYPESQSAQYKEYEVKAAFMYNFLKFIDWPEEKTAKTGNQITICILGQDPFGGAADILKGKKVEERDVVLKRIESLQQLKDAADANGQMDALKKCHLLFICKSEQKNTKEIIDLVKNSGVLTVADTQGFLDDGGIVNFIIEDNKVRFDINLTASEKAGIKIRSQLLRLAKKVLKDGSEVTGLTETARKEAK